jgi:hypothetical protein
MSQPDLDTVMARRETVKAEMAALDKMRLELEAEEHDLVVAERVLKRLAEQPCVSAPVSAPTNLHVLSETGI